MPLNAAIQQKIETLKSKRQPVLLPSNDLESKLWHFRETDVLAALNEEERHWLATSTSMVTCERGRVFYSPLERSEVVFILKKGRVNLYRLTEDGRKLVIASLDAHTIFGEMNLIGQGMYGCFAEAAEDCVICVLSRSDMQTLIRKNPEVGLRLLAEMGKRLQEREHALESLAFRSVAARLARLLLSEMDASGLVSGFTHQELAERLGTYRETVSQSLGKFKGEGLIAIEPKVIRVIDKKKLGEYASE
ncbi:MAG: Crp/Fnr family transcriptional regulator [Thermomicrobiales bacterium]